MVPLPGEAPHGPSGLTDDQILARGLDDLAGDRAEAIDVEDALDLGEEALEAAEVAAGDPGDGGDRLRVGAVGRVVLEAQLLPPVFEDEPQFLAAQGTVLMDEADPRVQ